MKPGKGITSYMESTNFKKGLVGKVFNKTFQALKQYPLILAPFVIFTLIEFIVLICLYTIPRVPLVSVFGPVVRTFWGEKFLHYPYNLLILPKLSYYSRMFLSIFIGSLLIGIAITLVEAWYSKKPLKPGKAFILAFKKYISLLAVILVLTAVYFFLEKALTAGMIKYFTAGHKKLLFIKVDVWLGPLLPTLTFLLALILQSAFAYAIPGIIIGKEKLIKSMVSSFSLFGKLFIPTLILVGLPMLMFVPVLALIYNSTFLISKLFPEIILYVLTAGVIINSLFIDLCIAVFTTQVYLMRREAIGNAFAAGLKAAKTKENKKP